VSRLDRFLPDAPIRHVDRIAVAAGPDHAYVAARSLDLRRVRWLHRLVAGHALTLADVPYRELVMGAATQMWRRRPVWAQVPAAGFADFDHPGWCKLGWALRVDGRPVGGSWITLELRAAGTDGESMATARRQWTVLGPLARGFTRACLRRLRAELGAGATSDAVVIEAPAAQVWSRLLRDQGRSGWRAVEPGRSLVLDGRAYTLEPIGDDATLLTTSLRR
jgi:hypothetical protein